MKREKLIEAERIDRQRHLRKYHAEGLAATFLPATRYSCPSPSPAPRVRSSLVACVVALNCSNRPVLRVSLIAAVAPCLVPRTSFRSLAVSPSSSSLSLPHYGQDRRTCRTLIAASPHAQP